MYNNGLCETRADEYITVQEQSYRREICDLQRELQSSRKEINDLQRQVRFNEAQVADLQKALQQRDPEQVILKPKVSTASLESIPSV